ncbi:hypothetical protein RCO48_05265 [Peribacillus frigoritolerans]|nr:hypothetical protein [Peribacillus frigoritolerans]
MPFFVLFIGTLLAGAIFGQPLSGLSLKGVLFGLLSALLFCALYVLQLSIRCWGIFHETAVFHCNGWYADCCIHD